MYVSRYPVTKTKMVDCFSALTILTFNPVKHCVDSMSIINLSTVTISKEISSKLGKYSNKVECFSVCVCAHLCVFLPTCNQHVVGTVQTRS